MTANQPEILSYLHRIKVFGWCLAFFLIAVMSGSLIVNLNAVTEEIHTIAHYQALSNFNKDQAIRSWSASHGGVYVPVDKTTPPNPYLAHIPGRDVEINGKKYTLMNPAYMVRQLNERFSEEYGVTGHITSQNPLRPENDPDEWELQALKSFEDGEKEKLAYTTINNKPYLRLIRPMIAKEGCLKCHAHQGYKIGDIRGGVGVSLPLDDLLEIGTVRKQKIITWHLLLMSLGLCGIYFSTNKLLNQAREKEKIADALRERIKRQTKAEKALQKSKEEWERTFNAMTDIVTLQDVDMHIVNINQAGCGILDLSKENIIGKHCYELFHDKNEPCQECPLLVTKETFKPYSKEIEHKKLGKTFLVMAAPVLDTQGSLTHIAHVAKDITEKKKAERKLHKYAETQTVLLREVNHRVKNNLTSIISMLHKEEDRAEEEGLTEYLPRLQKTVGRVEGLLAVHSMLSKGGWQPLLLNKLCEQIILKVIHGSTSAQAITCDVANSGVFVNSDQAHYLTLILNELTTNTIKYALQDRATTHIKVSIHQQDDSIHLIYQDEGPAFPEFALNGKFPPTCIGFNLIIGIVKQSLQGKIELVNDAGAMVKITFPAMTEALEKETAYLE